MALSIVCPGCDADYAVPENLIGKSIRCKKCGETIAVKAARPKAKARVTADDEVDDTPRRPARRNRDDDDDEDDAPVKKKSKGLSPVLIGGIAALILGGGGVAAYLAMSGDKKEDTTAATPPSKFFSTVNPQPVENKPDTAKSDTKTAKEEEKKPDVTVEKSAPKPDKVNPPKKEETKPGMMARAGVASEPGGSELGLSREQYMSGVMSPLTLDRVKKATVLIRMDVDGGYATGSGWFGIEPGIVFTNAHVLDMTAPNAPPPKKLRMFLNSGTAQQREIPHVNIKILAVDREIDLACLQIINEKDLPAPMKVRPSSDCTEGLGLNVSGFPFGYGPQNQFSHSGKEPEVSIRRTTVTAFRHNDFGILRRIQIEGAANPGNSGGPVVDAEGTVCGVIVEGHHSALERGALGGIALTGCVPTEYAFGIVAGRIGEVEYGLPYKAGTNVRIPVKVKCLDPFERLKKVGIRAWIGNYSDKYRAPGMSLPEEKPGDLAPIDTILKYDSKRKIADGEIELPSLPDNTVYWAQPYYENAIFPRYYMTGTVIETHGPPSERIPALLVYKPKIGTSRSVNLSNTYGYSEDHEGEGVGNNERTLYRSALRVKEATVQPVATDSAQAARLQLNFEELEMPKHLTGESIESEDMISKKSLALLNTSIKQTSAVALVNSLGQIYKTNLNVLNLKDPTARVYIPYFTNGALNALQFASIQMPERGKGETQPGQSWTWLRAESVTIQDRIFVRSPSGQNPNAEGVEIKLPPPRVYHFNEEWTARYVGVRERRGQKEAIIEVTGVIKRAPGNKSDAKGGIKGYCFVELDTGVVLESSIEREFDVDTSQGGQKKSVSGIYKYNIKRSEPNN